MVGKKCSSLGVVAGRLLGLSSVLMLAGLLNAALKDELVDVSVSCGCPPASDAVARRITRGPSCSSSSCSASRMFDRGML